MTEHTSVSSPGPSGLIFLSGFGGNLHQSEKTIYGFTSLILIGVLADFRALLSRTMEKNVRKSTEFVEVAISRAVPEESGLHH